MSDLWDAATRDLAQEKLEGFVAAASVAVAEQHGFVISASTREEFDHKVALVAGAVESAVGRVTYSDPASFPIVHQAVIASWERDFDVLAAQRQADAQRRNARRAYFRSQARLEGSKRTANFAEGQKAYNDGADRACPYPAPSTQPGSPESKAWMLSCQEWYRGWDRANADSWEGMSPEYEIDTAPRGGAGWSGRTSVRHQALNESEASRLLDGLDERYRKELEKFVPYTVYGPNYNRGITENLRDAILFAKRGEDRSYRLSWSKLEAHLDGGDDWYYDREMGQYTKRLAAKDPELIDWGKEKAKRERMKSGETNEEDELIDWGKKKGGFEVVDDSSGASTGTVYPNKEVAEQANYGDGYTVQYTPESEKAASLDLARRAAYGYTDDEDYDRSYDSRDPDMNKPTSFESFRVEINCPACGARSTSVVSRMNQSIYCPSCGERQYGDSVQMIASKKATISWEALGEHTVSLYPGLSEKAMLWTAEAMGVVADVTLAAGQYHWYVHAENNQDGPPLASGTESTRERAQAMAERAMGEHSTQMSMFSSKTAGENPFPKKDDEKKGDPKNDTTDSDSDGEQDGPLQEGEQPEQPAQDAAPVAQEPPQTEAAPQDKGEAQSPASTDQNAGDQQQPADPTTMDVGQSTSMGFTMVEGGSAGSLEVTFIREENGVYYFNGPTGEFGVGQMNGQWQDADGNTFIFGGAPAAPEGIAGAQEQAQAADAAAPAPNPAANAQHPTPAKDPSANPADQAPPADNAAPPADDGDDSDDEKKENPFAKKD